MSLGLGEARLIEGVTSVQEASKQKTAAAGDASKCKWSKWMAGAGGGFLLKPESRAVSDPSSQDPRVRVFGLS